MENSSKKHKKDKKEKKEKKDKKEKKEKNDYHKLKRFADQMVPRKLAFEESTIIHSDVMRTSERDQHYQQQYPISSHMSKYEGGMGGKVGFEEEDEEHGNIAEVLSKLDANETQMIQQEFLSSGKSKRVLSHTGDQITQSEYTIITSESGISKCTDYLKPNDQAKRKIEKGQIAGSKDLDLNRIKLERIDFLRDYPWSTLRKILLEHTGIFSIQILNQYKQLREIYAPMNFIKEVSLELTKLRSLNLRDNKLKEFPKFSSCMQSLESINLSKNLIEDLKGQMPQFYRLNSLQYLDLSHNKIKFHFMKWNENLEKDEYKGDMEMYNNFINLFAELNNIRELDFNGNPFINDEKCYKIKKTMLLPLLLKKLQNCIYLQKFNGDNMEDANIRQEKAQSDDEDGEETRKNVLSTGISVINDLCIKIHSDKGSECTSQLQLSQMDQTKQGDTKKQILFDQSKLIAMDKSDVSDMNKTLNVSVPKAKKGDQMAESMDKSQGSAEKDKSQLQTQASGIQETQVSQIDDKASQITGSTQKSKKAKKKKPYQQRFKWPQLTDLTYYLELANKDPKGSMEILKQLANEVANLLDYINSDDVNEYFLPENENDALELIQSFLFNAIQVISFNAEMRDIMLAIVAQLSLIPLLGFGIQCFGALTDLMHSGSEMEECVQSVIDLEIIQKNIANHRDPTNIPVTLLIGLYNLVEETENFDIVKDLYDKAIPIWIEKYINYIDQQSRSGRKPGNHVHYDSIINLMSASVNGDVNEDDNVKENVNKIIEHENLLQWINLIFASSDWKCDRYIPCLKLVASLANNSEDAADKFMENNSHNKIIFLIKEQVIQYKKTKDLFNTDEQMPTVEIRNKKYQTFAQEIVCLGGFLNSNDHRLKILDDKIVLDLLAIMKHEKTNPILLTAICKFCLDVFQCDEIKKDQNYMERFHKKIGNMRQLMPYLGFEKLDWLREQAEILHDAEDPSKRNQIEARATEDPRDNIKDEGSDSDEDKDEEDDDPGDVLRFIDDDIINELFISIINLIKYFCQQAATPTEPGEEENVLFDEVEGVLDSMDREIALFNCLKIKNDKVRLAVVQCLFVIRLEQFDSPEIHEITKVMGSCNNIGAGETEKILSTLYWICTKFVQRADDPSTESACKEFQSKFGENTVKDALKVLQQNNARENAGVDGEGEKYLLSLSITNFLKSCTGQEIMEDYLTAKQQEFKTILINEDEKAHIDFIGVFPIDIENSFIGSEIQTLLECLQGGRCVQPYSNVSLRILMKIANILQNKRDCDIYKIDDTKEKPGDEIFDKSQELYIDNKNKEKSYWIDIASDFFEKEKMDNKTKQLHKIAHLQFIGMGGIKLVSEYLTIKVNQNDEFIKSLSEDVFDDKKRRLLENSNSIPLNEKIDEMIETEEENFNNDFNFKIDPFAVRKFYEKEFGIDDSQKQENDQVEGEEGEDDDDKDDKNENTIKTNQFDFIQQQQIEQLAGEAKDARADQGDASGAKVQIENKLKEKEKQDKKKKENDASGKKLTCKEKRDDGFLNTEIRNLSVAAFLRILYSAIEYNPSVNNSLKIIQQIKEEDMFMSITRLCDTTNWDETYSIGAKYLRVMRSKNVEVNHQQTIKRYRTCGM